MRSRNPLMVAVAFGLLLAGCGNDAISPSIAGSYVRETTMPDGSHPLLHLDITSTGITVNGPPAGTAAAPGVIKTGSALFKKVKCTDESSCRFSTESGCEGTFSKEASGAVVVVATGDCEGWSGKWTSDKGGLPAASVSATTSTAQPSATASAPVLPTTPHTAVPGASGTPTASPSGTASASASGIPTALPTTLPTTLPTAAPTSPIKVSCLAACNEANVPCVRECKVGDLDCIKACSDTAVKCAQKCQ